MPLYEYECEDCKYVFEYLQRLNDEPLKKCLKCKKGKVNKIIGTPLFQFKGDGYPTNDQKQIEKREQRKTEAINKARKELYGENWDE